MQQRYYDMKIEFVPASKTKNQLAGKIVYLIGFLYRVRLMNYILSIILPHSDNV